MAIAVDATSDHFTSAGTTDTCSHTTSGSDRVLLVTIFKYGGGDSVTGVTYNGTAMTRLGGIASDASGYTYVYGLANPSTGANNIVATSSSSVQWFTTNASYTGVNQSTPFPDTAVTGTGTAATVTATMTTTVDQSWLFLGTRTPSRGPSAGTNTFERVQNTTSGDAASSFDSNGARSTGSNSLEYTMSSGTYYNVLVSFAPATAAGPTNLKSLDTNLKANIKSWNTNAIANIKSINTNT